MARSGLLTLEAHAPPQLIPEDGESEEAFIARRQAAFEDYAARFRICPASVDHLSKSTWTRVVEQQRQASRRADEEANLRVRWLLSGQKTFAWIFEHTYRVDDAGIRVAPSTLSCPTSRRESLPRRGGIAPAPQALRFPTWKIGPSLEGARGTLTRILVALPQMEPGSRLAQYQRAQPRIVLHSSPDREVAPFEDALAVPRLSLLWPTATRQRLEEVLLLERPLHLIFLPGDMKDLERPDRAFLDTRAHFTFEDFERRLD